MTLSVTPDSASNPTKLTIVSDRRVTAAVIENFTIKVATGGEEKIYSGTREVSPKITSPITITDSRGISWRSSTDDGTTAIYVVA